VPVRVLSCLHWDPLRLFAEIKHGLAQCARTGPLHGLGLDTWGVDFALLGRDDELLGNPFHHRDRRTEGMMERAFQRVPREEIFERTGIQCMSLNTLYQLLAMAEARAPALEAAQTFLTMPDLFNFWLSGRKVCEFTNATTTQMYDQRAKDWARAMLSRLGLPTHIFPEVIPPGTVLGPLLPSVAEELGSAPVPVLAPACHDTGSAVVAVPTQARHSAYISSGTWSLVGVEAEAPVITPQSLAHNFTNEGGVAGAVRLLKNVMGLWLLQECRRMWAQAGHDYSYAQLAHLAESAAPFRSLVDPDHVEFLPPGDMPARLRDFCVRTGQPAPDSHAAFVRCIFESLALKYRWVIEKLEALRGHPLEVIHVVGGGSQNALLCQLTADATGRPVIAGPAEATALGNALVQMMALGHLASLAEARQVVQDSFAMVTYAPRALAAWDEAYLRLTHLWPEPLR
jgi:rhamnulokinase